MSSRTSEESASERESEFSDPGETGLRRGSGKGLFSSIAARLWD
ncbi:hypothetical protein RYH80_06020 [Halobaculum sp. MBLA0147]